MEGGGGGGGRYSSLGKRNARTETPPQNLKLHKRDDTLQLHLIRLPALRIEGIVLDQVLSDKGVKGGGGVLGRVEGCQELVALVMSVQFTVCMVSGFGGMRMREVGGWRDKGRGLIGGGDGTGAR